MLRFLVLLVAAYIVESAIPTIKLQNSASVDSFIPQVGLGCVWAEVHSDKNQYEVGYESATKWLLNGGTYFDSAHCYPERFGVAAGVLNYTQNWTKIPRSDIFLVSKVGGCSGNNLGYNEVMDWTKDILTLWNTTYIDALFLHWSAYDHYIAFADQLSSDPTCQAFYEYNGPQYNATLCRQHSWRAMIDLYKNKTAKAIAVSNYEIKHLNDLFNYKYPNDGKVYLPSMNQIQFHGYHHEYDLLNFCTKNNIQFNSWSPLGAPDVQANTWTGNTPVLTQHPIAINIGKKYNKSAAQVWLRWNIQLNIIPIPRSNNVSHMLENMDIFDWKLSEDDMNQLYNITAPPYCTNMVYTPTKDQDPNNLP
eukprot:140934_1